jgi:hypothetical protein
MYLSFELVTGCDRDASRYRNSTSRLGRRRASHDSCCTCCSQPSTKPTTKGTGVSGALTSTHADAPLYRRI